MRRLIAFAALCLFSIAPGCKKPKRVRATELEAARFALGTMIHTADPGASQQLLSGFHQVEDNSWRWTKGSFAVTLNVPPGGREKGAWLVLKFVLADAVLDRLGSISIVANVNGTPIPKQTYATGGEHLYRKPVPASALQQEAVTVQFALDNFLKAGQVEDRELGVIAVMIGLEPN